MTKYLFNSNFGLIIKIKAGTKYIKDDEWNQKAMNRHTKDGLILFFRIKAIATVPSDIDKDCLNPVTE
jgi:hypothetical protein